MIELRAYRLAGFADVCRAPGIRHSGYGRYHDDGSLPTHYFALHPLGPLAELARKDGLRTWDDMLETEARVWAVRVIIQKSDDLLVVTPSNAMTTLGVEPFALIDDAYSECQRVAQAGRDNIDTAKIWQVPSAALPGTDNLVIFGDRQGIDYDVKITDPDYEIAACVVADRAMPPLEFMSCIRTKGDTRHRDFEERVRRGESFTFRQPIFNYFRVDHGLPLPEGPLAG